MTSVGKISVEARLGLKKLQKDVNKAKQTIANLKKEAEKTPIDISIKTSNAKSEIKKLIADMPTNHDIDVILQTSKAESAIKQLKSDMPDKLKTTVAIDTGRAASEIAGLRTDIRGLSSIRPSISVDTSSAMSAIDGLASKLQSLAQTTLTIGAVAGTVGATTYASQTQAVGAITAGTDVTSTDAITKAMSDYAARGYGDYSAFATDFNALATVMSDGVLNDKSVDKILKYINQTGAITTKSGLSSQDLAKAINSITKNFGVSEQTALDGLAYGTNNGLNYAGDFADSLSEYTVKYKDNGYDFEGMIGTLVAGKKAGVYNTDVTGDTLKEAALRVQGLSDTASEYLGSKGVLDNVEKLLAKGEYKKINEILVATLGKETDTGTRDAMVTELYGGVGENIGYNGIAAITKGADVDLNNDASNLSSEMDEVNSKMIEFRKKIDELKVSLIPLGTSLIDLANVYLPPIITAATAVADVFSGMSTIGQTAVIAITGLVAIGAPVAILATGLAKLGNVVVQTIAKMSGASAGAGLDVDGDGNDDGKNKKKSGKLSKLTSVAGKLGKKAPVIGTIAGVAGIGAAAMAGDWQGAAEAGGGLAGGLAGAAGGAAIGTMIAPGVGTAAGGLIGGVAGAMGGEAIIENFDSILSTIKSKASEISAVMPSIGALIPVKLGLGIMGQKDALASTASSVWSAIPSKASAISTAMPSIGALMPIKLGLGLIGNKGVLEENASSVWSVIPYLAGGIPTLMPKIGTEIVKGLVNGLMSKKDFLMDKAKELFNMLPDWAKEVLDIHSPSRVFAKIGGFVSEGMGVGIDKNKDMAIGAMSGLAADVINQGNKAMDVKPSYSLSPSAISGGSKGGDIINYNVDIHYSPDMTQKVKNQITRELKQIGYIR